MPDKPDSLWVGRYTRAPHNGDWLTAISSINAIYFMEQAKRAKWHPKAASFDYDLGGGDRGHYVLEWMIENNFWPEKLYVHARKVAERKALEEMIKRAGKKVSR